MRRAEMVKRYNVTTDGMVECEHGSWVSVGDFDRYAHANREQAEALMELREECTAQARLLGMSGEREAGLSARLAEAERERDARLKVDPAALRRDAARYRWLRERLEVRKQEALNGTFRDGLSVRIGCTFLDSEVSTRRSLSDPDAHENRCKKFDAAIDAAMERQP